jgi:hypothetical protein
MKSTMLGMIRKAAAFGKVLMVAQVLMFFCALPLLAQSAHAGLSVYVVALGPNGPQFGTVNLATGAFAAIATTPSVMSNLVWWNGSLLSLATSDPIAGYLVKINPGTGETTVVGPTGLGYDAFELAEVRGKLYLTDFNVGGGTQNIYSVDPQTGAVALIGPTGVPADVNAPFTTNADGTLNFCDETFYGVGGKLYATFDSFNVDETTLAIDANPANPTISSALYLIDPVSRTTTLVAPTNLFFDASVEVSGKFYGFKGLTTGFADGFPVSVSTLSTLDLTTGKATFVRNIDANAGVIFGAAPAPALSGSTTGSGATSSPEERKVQETKRRR